MTTLDGRVVLVTGVSRRAGIVYAIARRLSDLGATVYASGWPAHDDEMPWGADASDIAAAVPWPLETRDLSDLEQPAQLVDTVIRRFGQLDIVVAVHARSSHGPLGELTAEELNLSWAANVGSVVLLAKEFARVHDRSERSGRMVWFTSGQHIQPMPDELAYAITKGALAAMTMSLAVPLAQAGIAANCINPGPVDTGWADDSTRSIVATMFPGGRWGTVDDVANLVEFLVSDQGGWIQGQVINSEGGFRRT